jgi:hypothetical protein
MDAFAANWLASARCRRLSWLLHASVVETKHAELVFAFKAGFNPNQPRVPAGNPDGGQWTGSGGSGSSSSSASGGELTQVAQNATFDQPPEVPPERPSSARARNAVIKQVAKHVARLAFEATLGKARRILDAMELAYWVIEEGGAYIEAYADPPKSLDELQDAVSTPARGYDIHHIVEQTPAEQDGFPRSMIDAPDNLVRIPTFKHWELNAWYQMPNDDFGGVSPRTYLRSKDWTERTRVGRDALIDHGILKP